MFQKFTNYATRRLFRQNLFKYRLYSTIRDQGTRMTQNGGNGKYRRIFNFLLVANTPLAIYNTKKIAEEEFLYMRLAFIPMTLMCYHPFALPLTATITAMRLLKDK